MPDTPFHIRMINFFPYKRIMLFAVGTTFELRWVWYIEIEDVFQKRPLPRRILRIAQTKFISQHEAYWVLWAGQADPQHSVSPRYWPRRRHTHGVSFSVSTWSLAGVHRLIGKIMPAVQNRLPYHTLWTIKTVLVNFKQWSIDTFFRIRSIDSFVCVAMGDLSFLLSFSCLLLETCSSTYAKKSAEAYMSMKLCDTGSLNSYRRINNFLKRRDRASSGPSPLGRLLLTGMSRSAILWPLA